MLLCSTRGIAVIGVLLCVALAVCEGKGGGRGGGGRSFGRGRSFRRGNFRVRAPLRSDTNQQQGKAKGSGMTGIGLIFLILAIVALLAGLYFTAWCMCQVQRNHKEGHYILEADYDREDEDMFNKKQLYSGLDMVDEARETYVKNQLDLDSINENKPIPNPAAEASAPVVSNGNSSSETSGSREDLPPV